MLTDRYGLALTTGSGAAREAYVAGVDLFLSANTGGVETLRRAIAADPDFALAHAALARAHQVHAAAADARAAIAEAQRLAGPTSEREASHVAALAAVVEGRATEALAAITRHLARWPRDALVLQPATGVFGLIGFSGRVGREGELLALLEGLAGALGGDWWFDSALAFAEIECGRIGPGLERVARSFEANPRNANAVHIKSHGHYEAGERAAGRAFLEAWWQGYDPAGVLHGHLSWHVALWALEAGDTAYAWEVYAGHLAPSATSGPPINVLSDAASFLFRAELAGEARCPELWRDVSDYAVGYFPEPGVAFVDVHAALAHAMAGRGEALALIVETARGPAADAVRPLARGFAAIARGDWTTAIQEMAPVRQTHERVGGSRAQRDLIEHALALAHLRIGDLAAARALIQARPRAAAEPIAPVAGL